MKRLAVVFLILSAALASLIFTLQAAAVPVEQPAQLPTAAPPLNYVLEREIDLSAFSDPNDVWALHPDGQHLYLASRSNSIVVVDLDTGQVTEPFTTTIWSRHLQLNADGSRLYALSNPDFMLSGTLTIIDTINSDIVARKVISVPSRNIFDDVAAGPNNRLYVSQQYEIHTLDSTSGAVMTTTMITDTFDSFRLEMVPHGDNLYALGQQGLYVRYVISNGLPLEQDRRQTIYQPYQFNLLRDESALYMHGNQIPNGNILGRFTTNTFSPTQMITDTIRYFAVDQASRRLYTVLNSLGEMNIYDAQSGAYLGNFLDPDLQDAPEMVVGLPGDRFATIQSVPDGLIRIFRPAEHTVMLPMLTNSYCPANYFDDFSDPTSGWPILNTTSLNYNYVGGEYNIHHIHGNRWTAVTAGHQWDRRTVQVQGRIANGSGFWGIILGISPTWSSFVTLEMNPSNGAWAVFTFNGQSGWTLIAQGSSSAINPGVNVLEVKRNAFRANGQHIYWFDNLPVTGRIGFTSGGFTAGTDFFFDDYYYVRGNCPEPPSIRTLETSPLHLADTRPDTALIYAPANR